MTNLMGWFKGLKLKLLVPALVQAFVVAALGIFSVNFANRTSEELKTASLVRLPITQHSNDMSSSIHKMVEYAWATYGSGLDVDQRKKYIDLAKAAMSKFEESQKAYEALPRSEIAKETYKPVAEAWQSFKKATSDTLDTLAKHDARYDEMAKFYLNSQVRPGAEQLTEIFNKLESARMEIQRKEAEESIGAASRIAKQIPVLAVFALLVSFASMMFIGAKLAKNLLKIAESLSFGADEVATASRSISTQSTELSSSSREQASVLQETASAVEEVSSMVAKNAENASKSMALSDQSQKVANRGREVVVEMISAIQEINRSNGDIMTQIEASNRENAEIVKLIQEIGNKTKVINDIVFQTKLLSFNASVEAARAGEHGKGFAVVAEEVGNLAQMSGNAAKEISEMLSGSIERVQRIADDTRQKVERLLAVGREKVEKGESVAKRCGEVLDEIVHNTGGVNQMVGDISHASQEQSASVREIAKAMSQLDQVTQNNAAAAQTAAASSDQLSSQVELLRGMVGELLFLVQGTNRGDSAPRDRSTNSGSGRSTEAGFDSGSKAA